MGAHSAELYNNLGLCCLYSQQLDLTLACFQRALDLAIDPLIKADVWYNLSYVAIVSYYCSSQQYFPKKMVLGPKNRTHLFMVPLCKCDKTI